MEFKNLLYDMLVEEVQNKKLFNQLYAKWLEQDPELSEDSAEKLFTYFMGGIDEEGNRIAPLRERLSTKKVEVRNFLRRFNGQGKLQKFDPAKLQDLPSYSLEQLKGLLSEFGLIVDSDTKSFFFERPGISKEEKIKESKEAWFGDKYKIYDDGKGFRIYKPTTERESVVFGFYQESLPGGKWCVTNHEGGGDGSNYWVNYRDPRGRTFYFVIDETRDVNDQYYVSAVQVIDPNNRSNDNSEFRITNAPNGNGDMPVKLNDPLNPDKSLQVIYPQLKDPKAVELLQLSDYDPSKEVDLKMDDVTRLMGSIEEVEGSPRDFAIQDPRVKRIFIKTRGRELNEIRSLESLNDTDIKSYFAQRLNYLNSLGNPLGDAFKSLDYLKYILEKRRGDVSNYVGDLLKRYKSSYSQIISDIYDNTFSTSYVSSQDESIMIKKDTNSTSIHNGFAIFNAKRPPWLVSNGITYDPSYTMGEQTYGIFVFDQPSETDDVEMGSFDETDMYIIARFSKSGSDDDPTNFYITYKPSDAWEKGAALVSIFSQATWNSKVKPFYIDLEDERYPEFMSSPQSVDKVASQGINEG